MSLKPARSHSVLPKGSRSLQPATGSATRLRCRCRERFRSRQGVIGVDTAPGPTLTPIGLVCLGLSPALQVLPFAFDSNGLFQAQALLPANPGLNGLTLYMQAVSTNAGAPLLWSNGASLTLKSPKLVIIDKGANGAPVAFCIYDTVTDAPVSPSIPLPAGVRHAITIPNSGSSRSCSTTTP